MNLLGWVLWSTLQHQNALFRMSLMISITILQYTIWGESYVQHHDTGMHYFGWVLWSASQHCNALFGMSLTINITTRECILGACLSINATVTWVSIDRYHNVGMFYLDGVYNQYHSIVTHHFGWVFSITTLECTILGESDDQHHNAGMFYLEWSLRHWNVLNLMISITSLEYSIWSDVFS